MHPGMRYRIDRGQVITMREKYEKERDESQNIEFRTVISVGRQCRDANVWLMTRKRQSYIIV